MMKRSDMFGLCAVALVAGGVAISHAAPFTGPDGGARPEPIAAAWGGPGPHGGPMSMICGPRRDDRMLRRMADFEAFAKFTPAQEPAWNELKTALGKASEEVGKTCATLGTDGPATTAPAKLARVELMMTTGLDVVKQVRPAFDAFYGTLDEKQKAVFDRMGPRHMFR